jgi:hypothetical protein
VYRFFIPSHFRQGENHGFRSVNRFPHKIFAISNAKIVNNAINAFETTSANADIAKTSHAEATGGLMDLFKQGMAETRKQEAIVKIKYRDNPSKLASFAVAGHLERTLKKKKPEPTA